MIGINKAHALLVLIQESETCPVCLHHRFVARVDDGTGETALHGHGQKVRIDQLSGGEPEGNIGDTENGSAVQLIPYPAKRFKCRQSAGAVRGDGHAKTIDDKIIMGNPVFVCSSVNLTGNRHAAVGGRRNSLLIQSEADKNAAVFCHKRHDGFDVLLLAVDGIDHGLSVVAAERTLQSLNIGGINLQRKSGDALKALDDGLHHGGLIDFRKTDIDIQNVGARILLVQPFLKNVRKILIAQRLLEALLSGRVNPFADDNAAGADFDGLREAGDNGAVLWHRCPERLFL